MPPIIFPRLRIKAVLLAGFGLLGAGCTKSTTDPSSAKSILLIAHKWQLTANTYTTTRGSTTTTVDDYATMDACQKDNFLGFEANLTYTVDEGPKRCTPSASQVLSGTWNLASDETELELQVGWNTKTTYKITQLTKTTLQLVYTSTGSLGQKSVFTSTYSAI